MFNRFNDISLEMIDNLEREFTSSFSPKGYIVTCGIHNLRCGSYHITVSKNGTPRAQYLFYPGDNGMIESIAIYGDWIKQDYEGMQQSNLIFGLPIESIEVEHGMETYLDVYLKDYSHLL